MKPFQDVLIHGFSLIQGRCFHRGSVGKHHIICFGRQGVEVENFSLVKSRECGKSSELRIPKCDFIRISFLLLLIFSF
jgi:hypothetical protein